jgi:flagellar biosynthesis protein FliR
MIALLRELAIGATFALSLGLALLTIPWAVALSDGSEALAGTRRALAIPYALCAGWLVLALGAGRALVVGLVESFRDAPLAVGGLSARTFALGVAQLAGDALATAFGVALPLLATLWLMSLTLAALRRLLLPLALAPQPAFASLLTTLAGALLLVPLASQAPESVRHAIEVARTLTRSFAR